MARLHCLLRLRRERQAQIVESFYMAVYAQEINQYHLNKIRSIAPNKWDDPMKEQFYALASWAVDLAEDEFLTVMEGPF